jgi:uncharacterized protein
MTGVNITHPRTSDTALRLRGFGLLGVLAIMVIFAGGGAGTIGSAVLVLVWARLSHTPPCALGFTSPRNWTVTLVGGVVFGIVFKLGMKAIVMPLLGVPAGNTSYSYLAGNASALPWISAVVLISGGFGEEIFFRGYLFERLGRLLGPGKAALGATVLLTSGLFAIAHYPDQGLPGVKQAAIMGLVFGGIFARRKQLWFLISAHAAFDLAAIALIYCNLEGAAAHVLFR